jgi:hypothetical protein
MSVNVMPLVAWVMMRSRTAQTRDRQRLAGEPADHFGAASDLAE